MTREQQPCDLGLSAGPVLDQNLFALLGSSGDSPQHGLCPSAGATGASPGCDSEQTGEHKAHFPGSVLPTAELASGEIRGIHV